MNLKGEGWQGYFCETSGLWQFPPWLSVVLSAFYLSDSSSSLCLLFLSGSLAGFGHYNNDVLCWGWQERHYEDGSVLFVLPARGVSQSAHKTFAWLSALACCACHRHLVSPLWCNNYVNMFLAFLTTLPMTRLWIWNNQVYWSSVFLCFWRFYFWLAG